MLLWRPTSTGRSLLRVTAHLLSRSCYYPHFPGNNTEALLREALCHHHRNGVTLELLAPQWELVMQLASLGISLATSYLIFETSSNVPFHINQMTGHLVWRRKGVPARGNRW